MFTEGCARSNIDIAGAGGSCGQDGGIDIFDIFAVLDAFRGVDRCCAGGSGSSSGSRMDEPQAPGRAVVSFKTSVQPSRSTSLLEVDVFADVTTDIRGFQLAVDAVTQGHSLTSVDAYIKTQRDDFVFNGRDIVSAVDVHNNRIAAALYDTEHNHPTTVYLATFVFGASARGNHDVRLSLRATDSMLLDPSALALELADKRLSRPRSVDPYVRRRRR